MEVHHHPHVEKKNLKEYILEGLMIFIAVSLGFAAESLREHLVNKEREQIYMESFYSDLQNDQKDLPRLIGNITDQQLETASSLERLLPNVQTNTVADSIYYCLRKIIRQQGIRGYITDRTIEQIKNAGEMRLISKKEIADSLIDYYKGIVYTEYLQQTLLGYKAKLLDNLPLILKGADYSTVINDLNMVIIPDHHLYLFNTDPVHMNRILLQAVEISALSKTVRRNILQLLEKNQKITRLIAEKYHLEKD